MKNQVKQLLNQQMEARHTLAKTIVEQTREMLIELGCEDLLTVGATIQEVEVIKEVVVSSDEDKKIIEDLTQQLKKANKALDYNKKVNVTLREKIKKLQKTPVIKEVPVVDADAMAAAAKEHSQIVMKLNNQIAAKESIIESLNEKIKMLEAKDTKSNAKIH